MMRETTAAFLDVVAATPPPGGGGQPGAAARRRVHANRLGATLVDLRAAMEEVVRDRIDAGDGALTLVPGATC